MSHIPGRFSGEPANYRLLGLFSILLAAGILMVHAPSQIWQANVTDFVFPIRVLLGRVVLALAAIPALLALPLLSRNRSFTRAWAVAWFALAMIIWTSSSFLVLDVGILDGRKTSLEIPFGFALLSVVVLTVVSAGSIRLALRRPFSAAVAALALNLLLASVTGVALAHPGAKPTPARATRDALFRFSESRNALVILLDGLQSDLFHEIIEKEPRFKDSFDGFVFYPDTVGPAATTYVSLPVIHSGRAYDPDRPLTEIYRDDLQHGSFLVSMAKADYESLLINPVNLCPDQTTCVADETVLAGSESAALNEYLRLFDLALFRAAPGYAKHAVFNRGAWRARNLGNADVRDSRAYRSQQVLEALASQGYVSGRKPAAKFLHLFNTHPPAELDQDCQPLPRPLLPTRVTMLPQTRCAIMALTNVFEKLKQLGVYDRTAIAVIADHGLGYDSRYAQMDERLSNGWPGLAGQANPVLLFKPLDGRGRIQSSERRAQTGDVAALILSETRTSAAGAGVQQPPPQTRTRFYYSYQWAHDYWERDRIPGLKTFRIDGPVWMLNSWTRLRRPVLPVDKVNVFNASPGAEVYLDWGWSTPEAWGVWSDGRHAALSFSVEQAARRRPLRLTAALRSLVSPKHPGLVVKVDGNREALAQWRFDLARNSGAFEAILQPDVWSREDGGVTIQLHIDRPVIPAELGDSPDTRSLGVGLESLRLTGM